VHIQHGNNTEPKPVISGDNCGSPTQIQSPTRATQLLVRPSFNWALRVGNGIRDHVHYLCRNPEIEHLWKTELDLRFEKGDLVTMSRLSGFISSRSNVSNPPYRFTSNGSPGQSMGYCTPRLSAVLSSRCCIDNFSHPEGSQRFRASPSSPTGDRHCHSPP
jgi:hypothetical protein